MEVLVTGADQRQGLSVIRSLGKRGISVLAAGPSEKSMGFSSKYAAGSWVYPSPMEQPLRFISSLVEAVKKYDIKIVMPVVESTLVAVNRYREEIEQHAVVAAASREAVALSLDKRRHLELARQQGIPVLKTCSPASSADLDRELQGFSFPVVLKPREKPAGQGAGGPSFKVSFLNSREALHEHLTLYYRSNVVPIIQELCIGHGIGCGVLMDRGTVLCCYQYHRGREYDPTGGVPVRYESMRLWPHVRDYSVRLLRAMNWNGVAQVEWKNIPGTRNVVLMEVNGRFWASLPGAIHAGMDFPFWFYELSAGLPCTCRQSYQPGVVSRYLRGDLQRLEIVLRRKDAVSSVPLRSKKREIFDFIADFLKPGVKADIHSWSDPAPGFQEGRDLLSEFGMRAAGKLKSGIGFPG